MISPRDLHILDLFGKTLGLFIKSLKSAVHNIPPCLTPSVTLTLLDYELPHRDADVT